VTASFATVVSRVRFAGGLGGSTLPMIFFDPPSLRRFELLGVDSNPSVSVTC